MCVKSRQQSLFTFPVSTPPTFGKVCICSGTQPLFTVSDKKTCDNDINSDLLYSAKVVSWIQFLYFCESFQTRKHAHKYCPWKMCRFISENP